jgi:hypothetical protein
VATLQGLAGALTLAAVGGTWTVAGSTITLTVTSAGAVAWADITGKPATFAPSAHTHAIADTTGLQAALDGKQAAGSYAAASHTHTAGQVTGLATVATTGAYADLSGAPAAYSLPTATASVLGGVKIGSGLSIDGSGVVTAAGTYTLPAATVSALGGVIVGTGLAVSSGTISVSYGTSSSTACVGNDARLSDARTPLAHNQAWSTITATPTTLSGYGISDAAAASHVHGNITSSGAIGSTSGLPIITTASGVLTVGAFGSSAGSFCQGNDSRLSDSRSPSGSAGGDLTGTFPNPQIAAGAIVTADLADGAVTDAKITGMAATKLTGTLDDARLSSAVAFHSQINSTLGQAAGVIDSMPRVLAAAGVTASAGQGLLAFFTPTQTLTVSSITMAVGTGAVASGLTLARMGLYTYPTEGGTATLVARTASDTSLFAANNTAYTRSLDTAGGYPSTYTLTSGTRYAVAYICVGTTQPQLVGRAVTAGASGLSPRLSCSTSTGLSDLPTTFTPGTNGQSPFARLS